MNEAEVIPVLNQIRDSLAKLEVRAVPANGAPPIFSKRGYTIKEAAAYLGIKEWAVYQEMREGRLIAKKRGNTTLIDQRELDRYFDDLPERVG